MSIEEKEKITCQDFKDAICNIDFYSYNPMSNDFLVATNIGIMWLLLKRLNKEDNSHQWVDDIMEELEGVRKYLDCFKETKDVAYKGMAEDELRHAEFLINQYLAKNPKKSVWIETILAEYEKMKTVLEMNSDTAIPNIQSSPPAVPAIVSNISNVTKRS